MADFRTMAAEVGIRGDAPFQLFGATLGLAVMSPQRVYPRNELAPAIRRGDVVAVARRLNTTIDELLVYADEFARANGDTLAIVVPNGRRLPLRGTALLGRHDDAVEVSGSPRDAWAREVVIRAWSDLGLKRPNLATLQAVQSIGRLEGFYGLATKPEGWAGSWNWGAVQCKHGTPCGVDCFEAVDSHADGTRYSWCFKRYPSAEAGAADLIRLVTKARPSVAKLLPGGDLLAIATEMRATHYFEAPSDVYARGLLRNAQEIAAAIGEPLRVKIGKAGRHAPKRGAAFGSAALWGLTTALTAITWGARGH